MKQSIWGATVAALFILANPVFAQTTAGGANPPPIRRVDTWLYEQAQIPAPPTPTAAGSGAAIGGLGAVAVAGLGTLAILAVVGISESASGTN